MKKTFIGIVFILLADICFAQQKVVAVAPFEVKSGNASSDAETIAEIFGIELQARRVVRVVSRASFEAVMKEHKFQMGDLSDDKKTAELGKGMNADWIVRGQVQKLGTRIVVTASLLDVNSLEIMGGAPMYLTSIEDAENKMDSFIDEIAKTIGGGAKIVSTPNPAPEQRPTVLTQTPPQQAIQTVASPAKKPAPPTPAPRIYKIGERGPADGWIFYDKGTYSNGWRYLEAAPKDAGKATWGSISVDTKTRVGYGKNNTKEIISKLSETGQKNKAAQLCLLFSVNTYNDWFLPSKDELDLLYKNLKTKGLGELKNDWYWSSSNHGPEDSYYQHFGTGEQTSSWFVTSSNRRSCNVRPIRSF
jgi:TolB-like protein